MPKIITELRRREAAGEKFVSFEFFPPKTEDGVAPLLERMKRFKLQGAQQILWILGELKIDCSTG